MHQNNFKISYRNIVACWKLDSVLLMKMGLWQVVYKVCQGVNSISIVTGFEMIDVLEVAAVVFVENPFCPEQYRVCTFGRHILRQGGNAYRHFFSKNLPDFPYRCVATQVEGM